MLTSYNGQTITYDAIGNPLSYRDGISLTWQNGRQLATYSQTDGASVSYTYDVDGLRTSKTVTSGTTTDTIEYVYENGLLLQMRYNHIYLDFSYDANGAPVSLAYRSTVTGNPTYYYYALNSRGDVVGLYNNAGTIVAKYSYDAYGKLLGVTNASGSAITAKYVAATLNPLRYHGYVYDNETGFYYLQSRYYDPKTCRFVNADGYCSTGQDITGNNMFAYCANNPAHFSDPNGMWKQVSGGWQAQSGDTLWGLAVQLYGDGTRWTTFGFGRDPKSLQVGEVIYTGSEIVASQSVSGGFTINFRDVTREVNRALSLYIPIAEKMASLANALPLYEPYRYGMFGLLVNHGAAWDIKRKGPWESTIGTPFPGYGALVLYQGMLMTPENLGNYTYGLLGAAFGISRQTLIDGSVFAAFSGGSMNNLSGIGNEIGDWYYITLGYWAY